MTRALVALVALAGVVAHRRQNARFAAALGERDRRMDIMTGRAAYMRRQIIRLDHDLALVEERDPRLGGPNLDGARRLRADLEDRRAKRQRGVI